MRASAKALISSGLAKKGYKYVNVDEGWLKGRHPGNNTIFEDLAKFPFGVRTASLLVHCGFFTVPSAASFPDRVRR